MTSECLSWCGLALWNGREPQAWVRACLVPLMLSDYGGGPQAWVRAWGRERGGVDWEGSGAIVAAVHCGADAAPLSGQCSNVDDLLCCAADDGTRLQCNACMRPQVEAWQMCSAWGWGGRTGEASSSGAWSGLRVCVCLGAAQPTGQGGRSEMRPARLHHVHRAIVVFKAVAATSCREL